MPRQTNVQVIAFVLFGLFVTIHCLPSVVIVHDGDDDIIVRRLLFKEFNFTPHPVSIRNTDSVENARAAVCQTLERASSPMAILDYSRRRAVSNSIERLAQVVGLPFLRLSSSTGRRLSRPGVDFRLQMHPNVLIQRVLLSTIAEKESDGALWRRAAVIVSENSTEWDNYMALPQRISGVIMIRQWTASRRANEKTLRSLARIGVRTLIVDLESRQLKDWLSQASSPGIQLKSKAQFILTKVESANVDLKKYVTSTSNVRAFQVAFGKNNTLKLLVDKLSKVVVDILRSLVKQPSFDQQYPWQTSCTKKKWSGGSDLMRRLLREANTTYGIIQDGILLPTPTLSYEFKIMKLFKDGFKKIGTWQYGKDFKSVPSSMMPKRAIPSTTLRVTTIQISPFVIYRKTDYKGNQLLGNDRFSGFAIDLFKMIADNQDLKYSIEPVPDGRYGSYRNGRWDGMVGQLYDLKSDVAIAPLTITSSRMQYIDFSYPYEFNGITGVLLRSPSMDPSPWSFLQPVNITVWLITIIGLIVTSLVLFVTARLSTAEWHKKCHLKSPTQINQFTLAKSFWFTTGAFVFRGTNVTPKANSTRLVVLVWWIFVLLWMILFALHLGASVVVDRRGVSGTVNSFEDLAAQSKYRYGVVRSGSTSIFFKTSKDSVYRKIWNVMERNPSNYVASISDGLRRVQTEDNYVMIMESSMSEFFLSRLCSLTQFEKTIGHSAYGFAFQKGSVYRDIFSASILKLRRSGDLKRLRDKWYTGRCDPKIKKKDGFSLPGPIGPMTMSKMRGLFIFLFVGLAVAFLVCILEVFIRAFRQKDRGQKSFGAYIVSQLRLLCCTCDGETKLDSSVEEID